MPHDHQLDDMPEHEIASCLHNQGGSRRFNPTGGHTTMKLLTAAVLTAAFALSPFAVVPSAKACTNSSDRASDGSRCGDRASGCKPGGRGGIC
jgi:hypothetical protein